MNNKKYNLIKIVIYDIFKYGSIPLIMIIVIIISAILIIKVNYHTRLLIFQKNMIMEEKIFLDIEWRNLILEEKLLSNPNRIKYISIEKLHMINVDPIEEHVVIAK
ncbi:Cell division protein FtsL [Candidatus Arsenophonus lipoptenae]|uniref:Cell division protein FtsL n=1 Tax=Candidatus Arsenophonus lipoptenae TaxID=634113 RepID=A0A0X9VJB7_9GAMM|nr:cell division protein FtsL [Candidatus Arsenophonus lipoptenae]AMA65095.1 Cell division protein FtsL [Candidatus Arsenophonus lipoptenae]